jgi:hypothetical protein
MNSRIYVQKIEENKRQQRDSELELDVQKAMEGEKKSKHELETQWILHGGEIPQ